ncbi:hypothetical protein HGM15179_013340 [Zosterops borbonicus]|uniref:Uncharacterized protein n=1 Tax=Zosterops borbonicus TaxID=364589 RepID=A0A8K1G917_9PASS|nr:hypothetical protein HGM15179_013340 [Zosterops borbonicus]
MWEDCILRVCRDVIRKTKIHLELSLGRDIKDKYIRSKKIRENRGLLLLNQMGILMMEDMENVGLVYPFFASDFTAEAILQESQTLEVREEGRRKEYFFPMAVKGLIKDPLARQN